MINIARTISRKVLRKFLEPLYMQGSNPLGPTLFKTINSPHLSASFKSHRTCYCIIYPYYRFSNKRDIL